MENIVARVTAQNGLFHQRYGYLLGTVLRHALKEICDAACWASSHNFIRFYNVNAPSLAHTVLSVRPLRVDIETAWLWRACAIQELAISHCQMS